MDKKKRIFLVKTLVETSLIALHLNELFTVVVGKIIIFVKCYDQNNILFYIIAAILKFSI